MPYLCICLLRAVFLAQDAAVKGERVTYFAAFGRLAIRPKRGDNGLMGRLFLGGCLKSVGFDREGVGF